MRIYGIIQDARTEEPLSGVEITLHIGDTCLVENTPSTQGNFDFEFEGTSEPIKGDILKGTIKKQGYRTNTFSHKIMDEEVALDLELVPIPVIWPRILMTAGIILGALLVLVLLGLLIYHLFFGPQPPPAFIKSFTADPVYIGPGQPSRLKWEVVDAAAVYLQGEKVGSIGTMEVKPLETMAYTLAAEDKQGKKLEQTREVIVPPIPVIESFKAAPSLIYPWESAVLDWKVSLAEFIYITDGKGGDNGLTGIEPPPAEAAGEKGQGEKAALVGSYEVFPGTTTTYTLVAVNKAEVKAMGSVTVTVEAPSPPGIVTFTASALEIKKGGTSILNWETSKAEEVFLNDQPTRPMYSKEVCLDKTTAYTLEVKNRAGERRKTITITVIDSTPPTPEPPPPPPKITRFLAAPTVIAIGQTAVLQWETEHATAVYLNNNLVEPLGSTEVSPPTTATYVLKAVNEGGEELWPRVIEVKPVRCTIILYEFENYRGAKREFTTDTPHISDLDNVVSSIEIIGDCAVKVYSAPNYKATYQVITRSLPRLRGTWIGNNAVSSLKIIEHSTMKKD